MVDRKTKGAEGREPGDDQVELGRRLEELRPRLRRMVNVRIDPRLRGRLDPSDVIQEAFVDVTRRIDEHRKEGNCPFFIWVRFLTGQKLMELHRRHLGAAKRDARLEVRPAFPEATSASLASLLLDGGTSPSGVVARAEEEQRLRELLDGMKAIDREVLVLRHLEQMTNDEAAEVLGLSKAGASLRYTRAAMRLGELLGRGGHSGGVR